MKTWRTDPATGLVEVDAEIPTLSGEGASIFDSKVRRWQDLACEASHDFAVPVHWILGIIFAESAGFPDAVSPKNARGLMQLTSDAARAGLTNEQLRDPRTNIRAGARFVNRIWNDGDQVPEVASKYNAGSETNGQPHPSSSSPWGIREEAGYIDRVVAAANYARDTFSGQCDVQAFPVKLAKPPPIAPAPGPGPLQPPGSSSPPSSSIVNMAGTGSNALGAVAFGALAFMFWPRRRRARARARRESQK